MVYIIPSGNKNGENSRRSDIYDMRINFCTRLGLQSFHLNESIYIFSNMFTFASFSLTIWFDSSARFFHTLLILCSRCFVLKSCLLDYVYFESCCVILSVRTAGFSKCNLFSDILWNQIVCGVWSICNRIKFHCTY